MEDLRPDPELYTPMLVAAVRRSEDMASHAPTEDPLRRMTSSVREAADRLTGHFMAQPDGPLSVDAVRTVAESADQLSATLIRGLNDCLVAGALSGYVAINENRVVDLVSEMAGGLPSAQADELSDVDPVVEGWLAEIHAQIGPPLAAGADQQPAPSRLFAALATSAALTAELMRRESGVPAA